MKVIKELPNYSVDKTGKVINNKSGHVISQRINPKGYLIVALSKDGKTVTRFVHRLIALAYLPNPECYPFVRHLNDVKTDNDLDNLAWGNNSMNMKDRHRNGFINNNRKLTCDQVSEIRSMKLSNKKTGEMFGVSDATVSNIRNGKIYKECV